MLLGGLDTVTATLDCMIVYLAEHPERRRALVDDGTLVAGAVEELLRHQTPVMMVPRIIAQDYELGGVQFEAGDGATLLDRRGELRPRRVRRRLRGALRPRGEPSPRVRRRARTAASDRTSPGWS